MRRIFRFDWLLAGYQRFSYNAGHHVPFLPTGDRCAGSTFQLHIGGRSGSRLHLVGLLTGNAVGLNGPYSQHNFSLSPAGRVSGLTACIAAVCFASYSGGGESERKMREWEYRKLDLTDAPRRGDEVGPLNQAGSEGWELVSVTRNGVAYLKREKPRPKSERRRTSSPASDT